MKTVSLSQAEKDLINRMNHPMYTVSFIESWLNRPPVNVYSNAPTALQQCLVEGFMQAVRAMAAVEERKTSMDIAKVLTISTAHIPESVAKMLGDEPRTNQLGLSVYPYEYGFWIYVPSYEVERTFPEPLDLCMRFAKENSCEWLRLDCDAELLENFPIFDW